ncbi:MAG: ABC transporter permease subunit, partial [Polyangiaceae bacterium]
TYRESVRARILIGLAGVAVAVAFYSIVVGAFTLDNAPRVVSDLGAASISAFSIAVAIVIGATSLYRELEQKTVFPILARPIHRSEYLVGKYLGTLLTIVVFVMADAGLVLHISAALAGRHLGLVLGVGLGTVALLGLAAWRVPPARTYGPIAWAALLLLAGALLAGGAPDERRVVLGAAVLTVLEVAVVAAVATLFSSFSTPFLSALLTLGIFLVGRNADALARLPVKYFGAAVHEAGVVLSKLVPNLQLYVPPRPLLTGEVIAPRLSVHIGLAAAYGLAWTIALLTVAALVFRRRDFL